MTIDLRQLITSAINPGASVKDQKTLSDVIMSGVIRTLQEVLADHPPVPAAWLTSPRVFTSEVLRKLGLNTSVGTFEARLSSSIRKVILDHYRSRQDVVPSPRRGATPTFWEPGPELINGIKQDLDLLDLEFLGELGGGRSDSRVFGCYAKSKAVADSVIVVKMTEDESTYNCEKKGHEAAQASWMAGWVATEPKGTQISALPKKYFALISPLALPPTAIQMYPESLDTLVSKGQRERGGRVIAHLSSGYAKHVMLAKREMCSRAAFVNSMQAHWSGLQRAGWNTELFWEEAGLPDPTQRWIQHGATILCNPLWYVNHGVAQEEEKRRPFFKSFQHGDLNCSNVLVGVNKLNSQTAPLIRFIDFEKASEQSALLDICWLAVWLLNASHHPPETHLEVWEAVAPQVVAAVLNKDSVDRHLGAFQLGIDLITKLVSRIWKIPDRYTDENERGLITNILTEQFALTLALCSLAMAGYEVRKFNRAVDEGADYSEDVCRLACLWACSYLLISAHALHECVIDSVAGRPASNLSDSLRRMISAT